MATPFQKFDNNFEGRKPTRLRGFDYSRSGAYFITIVTHERDRILGGVRDGVVYLSEAGEIVWECWKEIPEHFSGVRVDAFVVMPDHVHGVLVFGKREHDPRRKGLINQTISGERDGLVGARSPRPEPQTEDQVRDGILYPGGDGTSPLRKTTLGAVVAYFKYQSTKRINEAEGTSGAKFWQRNYFDHIIRDVDDLIRVREYIVANPARWSEDANNAGHL